MDVPLPFSMNMEKGPGDEVGAWRSIDYDITTVLGYIVMDIKFFPATSNMLP